jgi:hypothetical protein
MCEKLWTLPPRLLGLRRYIWSAGHMKIEAARPLLKEFVAPAADAPRFERQL